MLNVVKTFEKNMSLKDVKVKIVKDNLVEKHYLDFYKVSYDPFLARIDVEIDCPRPLMKVQIYKDNGLESYEAILVENGKLVDPIYEVVLRDEKKLTHDLPYLALPVGKANPEIQLEISSLINRLDLSFQKKISEVIVNDNHELTMILSMQGSPASVFIGDNYWNEKLEKLIKLVRYMEVKNKKMPSVINLTNSKKVVVKFN